LRARAFQHEIDHLAGRLYIDLIDPSELVDTRLHPIPPG
jgi:peptide deformylase